MTPEEEALAEEDFRAEEDFNAAMQEVLGGGGRAEAPYEEEAPDEEEEEAPAEEESAYQAYRVKGAGTQEANGVYINNGNDKYIKAGTNFKIVHFASHSSWPVGWYIHKKGLRLYSVRTADSTQMPIDGWKLHTGKDVFGAALPLPTVVANVGSAEEPPSSAAKIAKLVVEKVEAEAAATKAEAVAAGALKELQDAKAHNSDLEGKLAEAAATNARALKELQDARAYNAELEEGQLAAGSGSAAIRRRGSTEAEQRLAELTALFVKLGAPMDVTQSSDKMSQWLATKGVVAEAKFEARMLIFGASSAAAGGIEELLGVEEEDIAAGRDALDAMSKEFATHGSKSDQDNWKYVIEGVAQDEACIPPQVQAEIDQGEYHGGKVEKGDFDRNHGGMRLPDFVKQPHAKLAKLKEWHVAALRIYTTNSFRKLNGPLREGIKPHPFANTVYYLTAALKKLRLVQSKLDPESFNQEVILWRGMANAQLDLEMLRKEGGTEMAPMSTTQSKDVALKYASSETPLIFKYKTKALSTGVSLKFVSVYPMEEEYLYPPGTFLSFEGVEEVDGFKIVTISPQIP
mmetsp:Transcript_57852/g.188029  ORF Transcript_57852/g.188029 Transcript_57852/m.188029 type:complete len:573 (-) Transcript_57852:158-1876(-)